MTGDDAPVVLPPAPPGPVPLSPEQRQLWLQTLLAGGAPVGNDVAAIAIHGPLDQAALQQAWDGLVARHGMLRSRIRRHRREGFQEVVPPVPQAIPAVDLGADPARYHDVVAALSEPPYDLSAGPLVRPLLVRLADDEHHLVLALHHLVYDGASLAAVVLPELVALYRAAERGVDADLPPAPQYADYAAWQADGRLADEVARELPWWRETLTGAPPLVLAATRPTLAQHWGCSRWFEVPAARTAEIRDEAHAAGATFFEQLLAAYAVLLGRWSGGEDVTVGVVADRRRHLGLPPVVGYCATAVPVRLAVPAGSAVGPVVPAARTALRDALAHAVPYLPLVEALALPVAPGVPPLAQAMLVLAPPPPAVDPAFTLLPMSRELADLAPAKYDVNLEMAVDADGRLVGRFTVDRDLLPPDFADRAVADWLDLLGG